MKNIFIALILLTPLAVAQTPTSNQPSTAIIMVKSSPASDALVAAAKEGADLQKNYDVAYQQARSGLDTTQKTLRDQLAAKTKAMADELKKDKKYAAELAEIDTLNAQLDKSAQEAQKKFSESTQPMQQKIAEDKALVDGLVPVVRKENNLKPTDVFDNATQTWRGVPDKK